jgi:hypothetical protein
MAQNNLRVIYQNLTDVSTLTASSVAGAGTPVTNLQKDTKSLVYRSQVSGTQAIGVNFKLVFPEQQIGGPDSGIGIVLAFTNLTNTATIRVRGFTGTEPTIGTGTSPTVGVPGTLQFDSGVQTAAPYQATGFSNWNADSFYTTLASTTRYTERKVYARVWIPITTPVPCTSILIEVDDVNINQFIECSRLIVGKYWSPKYNTSYGMTAGTKDLSSSTRSEAGDLVSSVGYKFSTLSFDLKWLTKDDRAIVNKIVRTLGTQKAMFVSLFPNNSDDWEKEQLYQIYGKISQLPGIDHSIFEMYSSQLDLEEV